MLSTAAGGGPLTRTSFVYKQRSTYDIAAAVQRQRNFNYQASDKNLARIWN